MVFNGGSCSVRPKKSRSTSGKHQSSGRAVPNKCVGHQHLKNPNVRDCGFNERVERKESNQRTTGLDQERYEVACLRQDIIDEYEKKSAELLEYLNSMEMAFDRQRLDYEDREAELLAENKELKSELEGGCRAHLEEHMAQEEEREKREWETQRAIDHLKEECRKRDKMLKRGQKRIEELEGELSDLQAELHRKDDLFYHKAKLLERGRKKLEIENANLKRKAALGWMTGCLSELFLRLDPDLGVGSVLKLVRKVQKEVEYGNNVFNCHMGQGPKAQYDIIQKEIRRLLNRCPQRAPSCYLLKDNPEKKDQPDIRRKRVCKGSGHWRPHSKSEATSKTDGGQLEFEGALQRVPNSPGAPQTIVYPTPCSAIATFGGRRSRSSCYPFQMKLIKGQRSLEHTPPSWTPAQDYLVQVNRCQTLRKMLRHLEASITFILGQERRRRKGGKPYQRDQAS